MVYPLWPLYHIASLISLEQLFNLLLLPLELPPHPNPDHPWPCPSLRPSLASLCISWAPWVWESLPCPHFPCQLDLVPGSTVLHNHLSPNPSTEPLISTEGRQDAHWAPCTFMFFLSTGLLLPPGYPFIHFWWLLSEPLYKLFQPSPCPYILGPNHSSLQIILSSTKDIQHKLKLLSSPTSKCFYWFFWNISLKAEQGLGNVVLGQGSNVNIYMRDSLEREKGSLKTHGRKGHCGWRKVMGLSIRCCMKNVWRWRSIFFLLSLKGLDKKSDDAVQCTYI